MGVSAEGQEEGKDYTPTVIPKSDAVRSRIAAATEKSALFAGLGPEQQTAVIDAMFEVTCTAGQDVITQGDVGDNFYVADSGEYTVHLKGVEKPVHTYQEGASFGELALMYNCPRAATVRCAVPGTLWGLDRVTFRCILMAANKQTLQTTSQFLKSVSVLSPLTDQQRSTLASAMEEIVFEDGEYVVQMGEPADALYLLKSGEVAVHKANEAGDLMRMKAGEFFGESALQSEGATVLTRQANVVAVGPVTAPRLTLTMTIILARTLTQILTRTRTRTRTLTR